MSADLEKSKNSVGQRTSRFAGLGQFKGMLKIEKQMEKYVSKEMDNKKKKSVAMEQSVEQSVEQIECDSKIGILSHTQNSESHSNESDLGHTQKIECDSKPSTLSINQTTALELKHKKPVSKPVKVSDKDLLKTEMDTGVQCAEEPPKTYNLSVTQNSESHSNESDLGHTQVITQGFDVKIDVPDFICNSSDLATSSPSIEFEFDTSTINLSHTQNNMQVADNMINQRSLLSADDVVAHNEPSIDIKDEPATINLSHTQNSESHSNESDLGHTQMSDGDSKSSTLTDTQSLTQNELSVSKDLVQSGTQTESEPKPSSISLDEVSVHQFTENGRFSAEINSATIDTNGHRPASSPLHDHQHLLNTNTTSVKQIDYKLGVDPNRVANITHPFKPTDNPESKGLPNNTSAPGDLSKYIPSNQYELANQVPAEKWHGQPLNKSQENIRPPIKSKKMPAHADSNRSDLGHTQFQFESHSGLTQISSESPIEHTQNLTESHSNPDSNPDSELLPKNLHKIKGAQRIVLDYIYHLCQTTGSLTTPELSKSHIREMISRTGVNMSFYTIRTALNRLKESRIIQVSEWDVDGTVYTLNQTIYGEYSRLASLKFGLISHFESHSNPHSNPHSTTSRKEGSDLNFKNSNLITKTESHSNFQEKNADLLSVDISSLYPFGIQRKQLSDIVNQRLDFTRETLNIFIEKFHKYWSNPVNRRGVKNPCGLFMSLAQNFSRGDDMFADIKTEEDEALEKYIESRRIAIEERRKKIEELKEMEFLNWAEDIGEVGLQGLIEIPRGLSGNVVPSLLNPFFCGLAREYFTKNLWPNILAKIPVKI